LAKLLVVKICKEGTASGSQLLRMIAAEKACAQVKAIHSRLRASSREYPALERNSVFYTPM